MYMMLFFIYTHYYTYIYCILISLFKETSGDGFCFYQARNSLALADRNRKDILPANIRKIRYSFVERIPLLHGAKHQTI